MIKFSRYSDGELLEFVIYREDDKLWQSVSNGQFNHIVGFDSFSLSRIIQYLTDNYPNNNGIYTTE